VAEVHRKESGQRTVKEQRLVSAVRALHGGFAALSIEKRKRNGQSGVNWWRRKACEKIRSRGWAHRDLVWETGTAF
jgi:transposase-like protein